MNLFIYGARGLGREVLQLSTMTHNWKSISFVDDYFDTSQKIYSHEVITFEMLDRKIRLNKNSDSTVINNNVYLQPYSVVGHDSEIGIHSVISTFVSIGGSCSIGSGVFIGMNSAIIQNICVGDFCIVGMGSVVYKSINEEMVVAGNPARELRRNESRGVFC